MKINWLIIGSLIFLFLLIIASSTFGFYTYYKELKLLREEIRTGFSHIGSQIEAQVKRTQELSQELTSLVQEVSQISKSVINVNLVYNKVREGLVKVVVDGRTNSGFIFGKEGYVITAYHVIENAKTIDIVFFNQTTLLATLKGGCKYSDVALLKVDRKLSGLTLGDSSLVSIGQPVIAIGNPFERETVTQGIISHPSRFVEIKFKETKRWIPNLIQFDAPVNWGNSGGPLVNSKGEVIGLIIARIDPKVGEGIYYAVASNKVARVVRSIIEKGSFDHPWLGIKFKNLTPEIAREKNLKNLAGVLVTEVIKESPADKAGIKEDDIIVGVDEIPIREGADLANYLGEKKKPEEIAKLTLIRKGIEQVILVRLGKLR